ncbi:hypothetical protein B0H14DRAFT_3147373 [Mycena olivaceomarginata]|nr:hypothetical protein B0H14DRAFT_3147373 [Mycena olivaceomarginata]
MPQQLLLRVRVLESLLDLLIPELQLHFMLGMMHRQQQLIEYCQTTGPNSTQILIFLPTMTSMLILLLATEGVSAAPRPSAADPRATWSAAGGLPSLPDVQLPGAELRRPELEVVDGGRLQINSRSFAPSLPTAVEQPFVLIGQRHHFCHHSGISPIFLYRWPGSPNDRDKGQRRRRGRKRKHSASDGGKARQPLPIRGLNAVSSEALVAETQAAEVVDKSELHKQLVLMKQEIDQEIDSHGQPLCYLRGNFFHRPRHPVFALHNSVITGLDPTQLYRRRVITMIQLHAVSEISRMTFFCTQIDSYVMLDGSMTLDVAPVGKTYFLETYLSRSPLVCTSEAAFPAYISARGAISKLMMRLMRNTFSTRMGPAPFSEMVSEIQHLSHADGELMYTAAANFYGQVGLKQYSAFDDPNGYAGSPPSIPYLKGLFTDVISAHRIFIERDIATKPLTVAKADHTFDVLKHMGGVKGERIFTAAHTVINEFEETCLRASSRDSKTHRAHRPKFYTQIGLKVSLDIPTVSISDSMEIEVAAHEILQDFWDHSSQLQLYLIALAIKAEHRSGATPHLHVIQCRTRNKSYSVKVSGLTSPSDILPSLCAILTNMSIINVGHEIRQTLQTMVWLQPTPMVASMEGSLRGNEAG